MLLWDTYVWGLMRGKRGRDGHEGEDAGAEKRRRVGDGCVSEGPRAAGHRSPHLSPCYSRSPHSHLCFGVLAVCPFC